MTLNEPRHGAIAHSGAASLKRNDRVTTKASVETRVETRVIARRTMTIIDRVPRPVSSAIFGARRDEPKEADEDLSTSRSSHSAGMRPARCINVAEFVRLTVPCLFTAATVSYLRDLIAYSR